jgi:Reverse transcriptase (RNA-dependent DNA polymerase)
VDFQELYSPIVNDTIWRMMLVLQIALKLGSRIIDIETAFLNGELSEEIYMNAPKGLDTDDDECVLLLKSLYGQVQSARQFYLKFKEVMIKLGFKPSEIEPCLFSKQAKGSLILVVVYVDDCYAIGSDRNLTDFIRDIQNHFKIKVQETPTDYLACEIKFNEDRSCAWLGQPHLIKCLEKSFGELIPKAKYQL